MRLETDDPSLLLLYACCLLVDNHCIITPMLRLRYRIKGKNERSRIVGLVRMSCRVFVSIVHGNVLCAAAHTDLNVCLKSKAAS